MVSGPDGGANGGASLLMLRRPSLIEGWANAGGWVVEGHLFPPAMRIDRRQVQSFGPLALGELVADHLPAGGGLLLLGTGGQLQRPPAALAAAAHALGLRIEAMDSRAAARTFNLLVQEDRQVSALIL